MKKRFILMPNNPIRIIWEVFLLALTIIVAISEPYKLVSRQTISTIDIIVDLLITLLFSLDIYLHLHTAHTHRRDLITDPKKITKRYMSKYFWSDLLAAIPFYLIVSIFLPGRLFTSFFRLFRLLKLLQANRILKKYRSSNHINPSVMRMTLLIFWILIAAHLISCFWMLIRGNPEGLSTGTLYLSSFYWTITTLTTIGYGDITPKTNPETFFVIIIEILGAGMYGFIIGNISNLIANIDVAKTQYREKLEKINTFMRYRNLPYPMQKKINDYYDYMWENRRGYDETSVLSELPISLKTQVSLFLNQEIIEKVPFFKEASEEFIKEIIMNLEPIVYTPGDYVMKKGELGHTMYFIGKGSVDVVSEDESIVYATLSEGQFVGEIALLLSVPRTATVKVKEYCDLYSLEKEKFDKVLLKYPVFAKSIQDLAEERRKEIEEAGTNGKGKKNKVSTPPEKISKVNGHYHDRIIIIEWDMAAHTAFYEITKKILDESGQESWKNIGRVFVETEYIDRNILYAENNTYKIRAVNSKGAGEWSEELSVLPPEEPEMEEI